MSDHCPICRTTSELGHLGDLKQISCPRCGQFKITGSAKAMLGTRLGGYLDVARLSYAVRQLQKREEWPTIDSDNLDDLLASRLPLPEKQKQLLMQWLMEQLGDHHRGAVPCRNPDHLAALVGVVDGGEVEELLYDAERDGLIQYIPNLEVYLKTKGWNNKSKLANKRTETAAMTLQSKRIFIVHGHDEAPRHAVARFLEKIGLEPIILSEQSNQGRTIIEKFLANADVDFAVVLLTPDDTGSARGADAKPRARQNVILELGYFIGKLGRERVCALRSSEIEIPSDILGVVWTDYDTHGGWHTKLAQELKAAGYEVDLNKLIGE